MDRQPKFKKGKRHVCVNCDQGKPMPGDLWDCSKFGWEISIKVAKEQRLCRD